MIETKSLNLKELTIAMRENLKSLRSAHRCVVKRAPFFAKVCTIAYIGGFLICFNKIEFSLHISAFFDLLPFLI